MEAMKADWGTRLTNAFSSGLLLRLVLPLKIECLRVSLQVISIIFANLSKLTSGTPYM